MEKHADSNKFNCENIRNTRMLHLVKKAHVSEHAAVYQGADRVEKEYLAWGYYSYMTYNRFLRKEVSSEHCFELRYPYSGNQVKLLSDQYFTLLDRSEDINSDTDPFEYDSNTSANACIPFLGIFLISMEGVNGQDTFGEICRKYLEKVEDACKESEKRRREAGENCIWKTFDTLNCVDLCLAVRTDKLDIFPELRIKLKESAREVSDTVEAVITPILFCEFMEADYETQFYQAFGKNLEERLNVRIGVSDNSEFEKRLKKDTKMSGLEGKDETSYVFDIIGAGDYAAVFHMNEYFYLFSSLCQLRKGNLGEVLAGSKEAERLRETEKARPGLKTISQWIKGGGEMTFHERFRFPKEILSLEVDEDPLGELVAEKNSFLIADSYIAIMQEWRKRLLSASETGSAQYLKGISLVKDLLYTYNDLWYQGKFTVRGYMFYAQMAVMMEGIEDYLSVIARENPSYTPEQKEEAMVNLISNIHESILCINNYNKLLQNLQQSEVNHPNYEIQTKVNAEKYFLAYTNFLMEICRFYFEDQEASIGVRRFYPIVSLDVRKDKIMMQMLFGGNFSGEKEKRMALYSVIFPDYPRFSNINHVLPLLSHEVSHYLRFRKRETRNEFLISYVIDGVSEEIARQEAGMAERAENHSFLETIVKMQADIMGRSLIEEFKNRYESEWKDFSFTELTCELNNFMVDICCPVKENSLRYRKKGKSGKIIWELMKEEVRHLRINILNFGQLGTRLSVLKAKRPGSEKEQSCRDYVIELCMEYYACSVQNRKENREERIEFYKKIGRVLESFDDGFAVSCLRQAAENLEQLLKEGKQEKRGFYEKVLQSFIYAAWDKEMKTFTRELGDFWSHLDLEQKDREDMRAKIQAVIMDISMSPWRSMGNFYQEAPKLQKFFSDDVFTKIPSHQFGEARKHMEQLLISLADMEIRFKNFFHLRDTLLEDGEEEDRTSKILEEIHGKLVKTVQKSCEEKDVLYPYIVSESGFQMLMDFGIHTSKSKYFCEKFLNFMKIGGEYWVKQKTKDKIDLYSEIVADLGMCAIFDLDSFGYLRFFIHISSEEQLGELPFGKDFESVRSLHMVVILSMFKVLARGGDLEKTEAEQVEELNNLEEKVKLYAERITNQFNSWLKRHGVHQGAASCEEIGQRSDDFYGKLKENASENSGEFSSNWKDEFYYYLEHASDGIKMKKFIKNGLIPEQRILLKNEYIKELCRAYADEIYHASWIEKVREQAAVKEIGEQYKQPDVRSFFMDDNGRTIEENGVMTSEERLALQVNFVQENYQRFKDRFMKLLRCNLDQLKEGSEDYLDMKTWPEFLVYQI